MYDWRTYAYKKLAEFEYIRVRVGLISKSAHQMTDRDYDYE